jgi:hypothetical protein
MRLGAVESAGSQTAHPVEYETKPKVLKRIGDAGAIVRSRAELCALRDCLLQRMITFKADSSDDKKFRHATG